MSVVGFDIGNDNCVIAIVKPKAIQILQNDVSKYETPSVVSFTKDRRQIGSAGASSAGMYPMSTISQIKRLIGQNYDDPGMAEEFKLLPFKTTRGQDGGILIEIEYLHKTEVFTPVEILAMLLSHLKQMTERNGDGTPVVDCVIGIPSYFNDFQRVAYLNAAEIAGLNPLRLIHDGTATAIDYGYVNQDIKSPTILVFVDVGHCDTQVTVSKFEDKKVTILAHAFDRNVGGRNFDRILYKYFADKFKEKHNIDIDVDDNNSHHKARVRLMAACEKAKKVLTANRVANISVDSLADEKDLVGSIKREDFDELSDDLVLRVIRTCVDALTDAKLDISGIHSVELVGSGSRIPAIGSSLGKLFDNKPPNRTLNGSECVARGCALQGVILRASNTRGYAYEVQDSIPFSVGFKLRRKSNGSLGNRAIEGESILGQFSEIKDSQLLFKKWYPSPCKSNHQLSIPDAPQDYIISAFYEYQSDFPRDDSQRSRYFKVDMFQNLPCSVQVEFSINHHGIIVLQSAKKEHKNTFGQCSLVDVKCHELLPFGMTQDGINIAKERENRLLQCDKQVEDVQHQKNALETFIYDTQNKLKDKYRSFVKVSEKERILKHLDNAENLINAEGDQDISTYTKELEGLQQLLNPIERLFKHHEAYTQAIKELEISIKNQKTSTSSYMVNSNFSCTEELLSAIYQLLRVLPKDIELLPMLVGKIKTITNMTNESNHPSRDVSKMKAKYANSFLEAARRSLSACHEDKLKLLLHRPEESDKVEDPIGEVVARLLYTIFDSMEEIICLKSLYIAGNQESDDLMQMVIYTCNEVEKRFKETKPRDILLDAIKFTQEELDGLRQKMHLYVVSVEAHVPTSKNSGKPNPQGSNTNEETVTQEAENETTDLHPLEIEKQLFGRYRYFVKPAEESNITKLMKQIRDQQKEVGNPLQPKPQMDKMLETIKKRYHEYHERPQVVGKFFEFIFDIRLSTQNKVVLKSCDEEENWLKATLPRSLSTWVVLENKLWSSDIKTRMENFKTRCQSLMQDPGVEQQIHDSKQRESWIPSGVRRFFPGQGAATSSQFQRYP